MLFTSIISAMIFFLYFSLPHFIPIFLFLSPSLSSLHPLSIHPISPPYLINRQFDIPQTSQSGLGWCVISWGVCGVHQVLRVRDCPFIGGPLPTLSVGRQKCWGSCRSWVTWVRGPVALQMGKHGRIESSCPSTITWDATVVSVREGSILQNIFCNILW